MQKCNVEIETLSPIHIWNWKNIFWIDYFCLQENLKPPFQKNSDWKDIKKEAFLYKFRFNDFLNNILDKKDKKECLKILELWNDTLELRKFIFNVLQNNKSYQEKLKENSYQKIKITNSFYKLWKEKIIWKPKQLKAKTFDKKENEINNQLAQLNIQEFINSLGRYYIPWSSLKWAIRTCLTSKNIEKNNDAVNDVFKKLVVRDSNFVKNKIEIWSLARQSNKQKNKNWDWVYAEFLNSWIILNTEIIIKDFIDEKKMKKIDFSKENIIKKINTYTENKIEKYIEELNELLKHPDINKRDTKSEQKQKKIKSVIESFEKIKNKFEKLKDNECILNIWFWWWYWFKVLEEIEEKHPKFCSKHWNWDGENWCKKSTKKVPTECDIIAWMPVKHLKDNEIQIPRTNWQINLENLWFIKLTFKD